MTRKEILSKIEETYNKIYAFTDSLGDEALNILDEHTGRYNLSDEDSTLMEAMCDGEDPSSLSKDTLSCLLDAYKETFYHLVSVQQAEHDDNELRVEIGYCDIDDLKNDNSVNKLF